MSLQDTPIHQHFGDGDVIVTEGIMSNNAYVILKGKVRVTKKIDKKIVAVGTLTEGEVFGEMGLISETVRSANITAIGDVTVGVIYKEFFDKSMNDLQDGMKPIILALVERLRMTTHLLTRIGLELESTKNKINSYTLNQQDYPKPIMPTFTYKSRVRGKMKTGEVEAEDEKAAVSKLKSQNIRPTTIKKKGGESALFGPKVHKITTKDVVIFTRQFSTMVDAGLPLVQCLDILGKQSDNPTFGETILKVKSNIEVGNNLSESLKKFPKIWDSLYCNLVEAGEVGGILDIILRRLAAYIEKAEALKKKVKSAMVYPGAIMTVAFVVVAFLMVFVIPSFAAVFAGGGQELPGPTQIVMNVSDFFRDQWYVMIGGVVAFIFVFKQVYATERGNIEIDRISLKLPVVGVLIQKVSVAKFSRTLGTLISSGVPLIEALDICARTSGNKIVEIAVFKTIAAIKEGETIAAPLSRESVFPPMVIQMIDVGESSGALDKMLSKIADFYDEEVDAAVEGLTSLMEPMLMVFLGCIVGFIVVAMYLPIFKMGEAI